MRIFPILTAALVCFAIYMLIFERDRVLTLAGFFGPSQTVDTTPQDPAPSEEAQASATTSAGAADPGTDDVHVLVRRSTAQVTENAVALRGRTEALRSVVVAAEISGRVISEPIRAGGFVQADAPLCQIDPGTRITAREDALAALDSARARLPEAEAQLAGARAQLTAAEIDANAATRLSASGFASETRAASAEAGREGALAAIQSAEAAVAQARSGIRSAEAAVTRAEQDIARLTILAPFAGYLETDTAELGSLLQPGSPCATIIQLDPIKLVGFVPEAQVDRVRLSADASARLASGREVTGTVSFVSRSADERTRTFRVEMTLPNPDVTIRDGQTADILIQSEGTLAHLLPASSMTLNDVGTLGVRSVEDGIVRFMPVRLIRDTANGVWLSGLPELSDVIVVGQEFVTDGIPVRVTYEELSQ